MSTSESGPGIINLSGVREMDLDNYGKMYMCREISSGGKRGQVPAFVKAFEALF